MPALDDHTRRDAEHAARALIRIAIGRYTRRMDESAKGYIKQKIEEAANSGEAVDGYELGQAAANQALHAWFEPGAPQPAIEAEASPAGEGEAPTD